MFDDALLKLISAVTPDDVRECKRLGLGELIKQEQEAGRLADKGQPKKCNTDVTFLKDYGLTRMDSHRAQQVAEHQDLIPIVVARATELRDIPTRKDLETLINKRRSKNEATP